MRAASAVLLVGGVGVVAGLGYLVLRARRPAAPSACEAFGGLVGDIAGWSAGPADASANASARNAAMLACKAASALPLGKVAATGGKLAKGIVRAPLGAFEGGRALIRTALGKNCIGKHCCERLGKRAISEHRAGHTDYKEYAEYGNERLTFVCVDPKDFPFPDSVPVPRTQAASAYTVNDAGARDHRS